MPFSFTPTRRAALGVLLAAALPLSACGGGEEKPKNGLEKSEVTVGVMPITEGAAIQIAQSKGFFKAEGLTVKMRRITGAAEALPMLKGGGLDIAHAGHVGVIQAHVQGGYKLRILAEASAMTKNLTCILVPKDSDIRSPKDLAGKRIGTNARGNQTSLLVRAALAPYQVKVDEQKNVIEAPFPAQEQLLKTDKVDAVVVPEPFVTQIQQATGARILTDFSTGPTTDFPITGFSSTEQFATQNPKTVAAFQRALVKAQNLAADRAVLKQEIPKFTQLSPQIIDTISMNAFPTSTRAQRIQKVADVMKQFEYLKEPFDVKSIVVEN
ncbi:ABC transporter substrate-binding protein [Actinomadura kijaniata]|uniref:NitT/TauT family transport system substrate-binding protein n=1 Tax=Actinomadura namibiensis TaxID=182080 RepID=A0A7W3QMP9_ACTNM|nr:ABC transporter substrate-binding protein [Actinomadura namibiensis]MBA8952243.1 NitT/TauT family transport system substrate-binding protein [Actinomadura namibiensis]